LLQYKKIVNVYDFFGEPDELFMYKNILNIDVGNMSAGIRAKTGTHMPTVLSVEEVSKLLALMSGIPKLMAEVIYGGGLKVMECCRLRVKDIDFDNKTIRKREGIADARSAPTEDKLEK
jgi:integrase